MLLHRHFQWLTTSSTLVYCVSKMSDYTQAEVARLVGLQASVICAGTIATLMTSGFKCKIITTQLVRMRCAHANESISTMPMKASAHATASHQPMRCVHYHVLTCRIAC